MKPGPASATVITLTSTPERLVAFRAAWEAIGAPLPLNVHCSEPHRHRIRGCYEAHVAVWTANAGPVLILEDDAVFAPRFTLDVAWPDDADLFYLGGEHEVPPVPVAPGIVRAVSIRRTHGYVAWDPHHLAETLGGQKDPIGHVDNMMKLLPLQRYAVTPFTIGQHRRTGDRRSGARFWN